MVLNEKSIWMVFWPICSDGQGLIFVANDWQETIEKDKLELDSSIGNTIVKEKLLGNLETL